MTRLRGWLVADLVVLAGAVVTGVHVGRAHGTLLGLIAGGVFFGCGIAGLVYAVVRHGLRDGRQ